MRYLTRLNVLGTLAFISVMVALSLLYASGNFYTVGSQLRLPGTSESVADPIAGHIADPPSKEPTTAPKNSTILPNAENRLVVFGDAWSGDIGSQPAEQGRAWPEWLCMMVRRSLLSMGWLKLT
jgi:hypothetical protein